MFHCTVGGATTAAAGTTSTSSSLALLSAGACCPGSHGVCLCECLGGALHSVAARFGSSGCCTYRIHRNISTRSQNNPKYVQLYRWRCDDRRRGLHVHGLVRGLAQHGRLLPRQPRGLHVWTLGRRRRLRRCPY
ncbi:hypothetical protein PF001_g10914 [Phytophthora fragariae]|uniref:Uncharacterized protein n=1 Tax=Phytophthora fragariae TaxID=53985 RepID=A0A6A4DIE2_9STRA|nr:hypothetical protein PF003_g16460 [Phytophthora fragariae]KAE9308941.1 hypothetical protein PF001_g10914 [Phytophthora fragariae]